MTWYIQNDLTSEYWNDERQCYQIELTVICAFEDYDEAMKAANINDLTNYTIKSWS